MKRKWWFHIYRVVYKGEPQWLITVMGRRFVVRYCERMGAGW